jgi:hypothetical protein
MISQPVIVQLQFIIVYQLTVNCFSMLILQDQLPPGRQLQGFIASFLISISVALCGFAFGLWFAHMSNLWRNSISYLWIFDGIVCTILQLSFWYWWLRPAERAMLCYLAVISCISWVLTAFLSFI